MHLCQRTSVVVRERKRGRGGTRVGGCRVRGFRLRVHVERVRFVTDAKWKVEGQVVQDHKGRRC
jgi:hypothetical protein